MILERETFWFDSDPSDIYNRVKEDLLKMQGPTQAEWHRIIDIKQTNEETFEAFAEVLWGSI